MKTFSVKKVKVLQNVSVVIVYAFLYQYLYVRLFKRLIKSDGFSRIAFAAKGQRRLVVNAAVSPAVAAAERRQGQATDGSGYRSSAREREPGAARSPPRRFFFLLCWRVFSFVASAGGAGGSRPSGGGRVAGSFWRVAYSDSTHPPPMGAAFRFAD